MSEERPQTKKCPKCAEEIQLDAKKCKHCGSDVKKKSSKIMGCLGIIIMTFFIIIIIAVSSDDSGTSNPTSSLSPTLSTGEEGILNNNKDVNVCDGMTVVGVTEEDINASIDSSVANDNEGQAELLLAGRIFLVKNCKSIRKIDTGGTLSSLAKVRFIGQTDDLLSTIGWIPYEFAKKK